MAGLAGSRGGGPGVSPLRSLAGVENVDRGGRETRGQDGAGPPGGTPLATSTRVGFDQYTIGHLGLSAEATLRFARDHGLDGVQFLDPEAVDPSLDLGRLDAFRRRAEGLGLYLETGLTSPNPVRRSRAEGRPVSAAEHARDLERQVAGVAALGCRFARAYVGDRHDRFRTDTPWADQIDATVGVLRLLTPCLRGHGVRVALETHADITADELLGVIARLDGDVAGVTLDTGNLVMRLDDPVRAAERLAPHVLGTHVKDCVLARTPRGLAWQARPVGSGILPMPDLLAPLLRAKPDLSLTIELHPRTYDLPTGDPTWLAHFPDAQRGSLPAVLRLADLCEARYATGFLDRPGDVESVPWADRDLDWLARSVGYLRSVVPVVARLDPPRTARD